MELTNIKNELTNTIHQIRGKIDEGLKLIANTPEDTSDKDQLNSCIDSIQSMLYEIKELL